MPFLEMLISNKSLLNIQNSGYYCSINYGLYFVLLSSFKTV